MNSVPRLARRRASLAVAAVAAILLVATVAWFVTRDKSDPDGLSSSPPTASDEAPAESPAATSGTGPTDGAAQPTPDDPAKESPMPGGQPGRERAPVVDLADTSRAGRGLVLSIVEIEPVRSRAELPGELSRPALRVTVQVDNTSARPARFGAPVANLYYGESRTPSLFVQNPGSKAFPARVRPGGSATGVFVFNVPRDERRNILVEVDLDDVLRIVTFEGDAA